MCCSKTTRGSFFNKIKNKPLSSKGDDFIKTIAAIATANGLGGISVVRISGDNAIEIADKIFVSNSKKKLCDKKGYTATLGKVIEKDEIIDEAIATVFKAPHSYTGEDVVEVSCHGGIVVTKRVLRAFIENGAELACAGEFTKRAFLNGKMNLMNAQAVIDIINANTEKASKLSVAALEGALSGKIMSIKQQLIEIAGHLGAWVDFPEEDIEEITSENLSNSLNQSKRVLDDLISSYDIGRIIKQGLDVVICGKPNVGKSTLMNLLCQCEKSIVTDIAGTTRDIIEESVILGDVVLRLSDTAGIREVDDVVERLGVDKAKNKLKTADLILLVLDSSRELCPEDIALIEQVKQLNTVLIINKSDLQPKLDKEKIGFDFKYQIEISAKNNQGLSQLEAAINEIFRLSSIDSNSAIIANERQRQCVLRARENISEALDALNFGLSFDALTVSIELAIDALLEMSGEKASATIVDEIFSQFCVGK